MLHPGIIKLRFGQWEPAGSQSEVKQAAHIWKCDAGVTVSAAHTQRGDLASSCSTRRTVRQPFTTKPVAQ